MSTRSRPDVRHGLRTTGRLALLLLALLTVILIVENTRNVTIRLIVPEVTLPLWVPLLGMAALGALGGVLVGLLRRR